MRKFRVPLPPPPTKKFKITIKNTGKVYEVDPDKLPYSRHGLPGSVLDVVGSIDEEMIDHACGGVQACSTCHVYITEGLETTNEVSDREQDYVDQARGPRLNSRLACCCVANGSKDLVVDIPSWNINSVKEGK